MDEVRFMRVENGKGLWCSEQEAEYAVVEISKYHGYEKLLRMVRERAVQQVDRSVADKHGYTLLRAEYKPFRNGRSVKAWRLKKETPYSLKIPVEEAMFLIRKDIEEFYGNNHLPGITADLLELCETYRVDEEHWQRVKANPGMKEDVALVEDCKGELIGEPDIISSNLAKGTYEVTYWASVCK